MKSYLIVFICVLVLILNFSTANSKKNKSKELSESNESNEIQRPDPSGEPLPQFWTTGSRPNFPIQMNKKYKKYHTRLASSHRYKDHSKDLLKKNKKKTRNTRGKKLRKNRKHR
jgi:hypothetical protein